MRRVTRPSTTLTASAVFRVGVSVSVDPGVELGLIRRRPATRRHHRSAVVVGYLYASSCGRACGDAPRTVNAGDWLVATTR